MTALVMVQVKVVEPVAPEPSEAVMVTEDIPAVVGEPVMVPVAAEMDRPAGRPVADHVMVATGEESCASSVMAATARPATSNWLPGLVTVMVFG